jgi:hypothetical protein
MPFCGFHPKMVTGLVIFAEGLFAATLERAQANNITIEQAYQQEVKELGIFLEALENRYQIAKDQNGISRREVMEQVAAWVGEQDEGKTP